MKELAQELQKIIRHLGNETHPETNSFQDLGALQGSIERLLQVIKPELHMIRTRLDYLSKINFTEDDLPVKDISKYVQDYANKILTDVTNLEEKAKAAVDGITKNQLENMKKHL